AILVVDDDFEVLDTIGSIVEASGHQVTKAGNGRQALDLLDRNTAFDLMITDVVMPGLNGFNLARIARMRRPKLSILFLTGFHDYPSTIRDPIDQYGRLLYKPILPADLRNEVATALAATPRA